MQLSIVGKKDANLSPLFEDLCAYPSIRSWAQALAKKECSFQPDKVVFTIRDEVYNLISDGRADTDVLSEFLRMMTGVPPEQKLTLHVSMSIYACVDEGAKELSVDVDD